MYLFSRKKTAFLSVVYSVNLAVYLSYVAWAAWIAYFCIYSAAFGTTTLSYAKYLTMPCLITEIARASMSFFTHTFVVVPTACACIILVVILTFTIGRLLDNVGDKVTHTFRQGPFVEVASEYRRINFILRHSCRVTREIIAVGIGGLSASIIVLVANILLTNSAVANPHTAIPALMVQMLVYSALLLSLLRTTSHVTAKCHNLPILINAFQPSSVDEWVMQDLLVRSIHNADAGWTLSCPRGGVGGWGSEGSSVGLGQA